ncbi:MAG: PAS domain-containing protein [Burkholderiaceae bacterium]
MLAFETLGTLDAAEAHTRLGLALDAGRLGYWELDLPARRFAASTRCQSSFGRQPGAAFTYDDLLSTLSPQDRERMASLLSRTIDTGADYEGEYPITRPDGTSWVLMRGQLVRAADGTPLRLAGISLDITRRKVAEAALAASELRFNAITDSIDQMIWSTRPDGFHDFYNRRWYEYTGVPAGSTDGAAWNGMFHPDDQERAWSVWRESLATGKPYHIEYRLRHRSGQYRWTLGRAQAVRDERGEIIRWYGTCTDIHELVEARELIARSEQELARLVDQRTRERDQAWEHSLDLQAVVRPDGVILAANAAWEAILGWRPDEVVGRSHLDFNPSDASSASQEALRTASRAELPANEGRCICKDGGYRWISWVAKPENGLVYASGRDVTAQRQAAFELDATREQLRQSQKMEAVGQLTGGIAHDFNNLLGAIYNSLEVIKRAPDAPAKVNTERFIEIAQRATTQAASLTKRLLSFARQQPMHAEPTDLHQIVRSLEDLVRTTVGSAVTVRVTHAAGPCEAFVDVNQFENALLNLSLNARDAMPAGGTLTISTAARSIDEPEAGRLDVVAGDYAELAIVDTGVGMVPEVADRVFEPFFTTKPLGKGTGLGLSMVYGFARQAQGQVSVHSVLGQGTTMRLLLPRLDPSTAAAAQR